VYIKIVETYITGTDMTIHWKALEEHFLMVPLVFQLKPFSGYAFSEFFSLYSMLSFQGG
jgi:hypothetical protein